MILKPPCDCKDMIYICNNTELINKLNGHWIISWKELDKTGKGINIETLGVKISYCPFCGKLLTN